MVGGHGSTGELVGRRGQRVEREGGEVGRRRWSARVYAEWVGCMDSGTPTLAALLGRARALLP